MGNCLVTKLKGVVDNDNLIGYGRTRISFVNFNKSGYKFLYINLRNGSYIDIIGATFTDGSTRFTATPSKMDLSKDLWPESGNFMLDIPRYGSEISDFGFEQNWNSHQGEFNLKDFEFYTHLAVINLPNSTIHGTLSDIKNSHKSFSINFYGTKVYGTTDDIYELMKDNTYFPEGVAQINLHDCNISGKLKNLLDKFALLPNYRGNRLKLFIISSGIDTSDFSEYDFTNERTVLFNNDGTYTIS